MPPPKRMSDVDALIAAVIADPDDDTPRLVYADWLNEQGRPDRAEFIRVQCELARLAGDDPRRPDLEERAEELLGVHEAAWMADVPGWARKGAECHRGFVSGVRARALAFIDQGGGLCRRAPVHTLHLTSVLGNADRLAASPHLAGVRDLHLYDVQGSTLPALLASPHLGSLAGLHLESHAVPPALTLFSQYDALFADRRLPRLSRLGLCNVLFDGPFERLRDGAFDRLAAHPLLATLTSLRLSNTGLSAAQILTLAGSTAGLRELDLSNSWQVGDEYVRALAASPHLGELRRLDLGRRGRGRDRNPRVGDAGARALAESPHLRNLTDLDLRFTDVTDAGLDALANSPNLPRLTRIDVPGLRLDAMQWRVRESARGPDRYTRRVWVRRVR